MYGQERNYRFVFCIPNEPEYSYTLVKEDVGYYLMAAIAPKHLRRFAGKNGLLLFNSPIKKGASGITPYIYNDFQISM